MTRGNEPPRGEPAAAGTQTVTRALAVLGCFRASDELGVSEISRTVDLPVSTTHRLLRALVDAGFLEQDPDSSRYQLGGALTEYGQIAYRNNRIHLAEPHLEQLATTTGATASIATRHGGDAVMLGFSRWREAAGHQRQGLRLPLHASALGRALLAWSSVDDAELERIVATATAAPDAHPLVGTITHTGVLRKELDASRERGYAFRDEETQQGFCTLGVPVLGPGGIARFALGLRGPVELMIPERIPFLADLARATAADIAQVLIPSP